MNRKILFSPIGGTDPISNGKDGSMLHICRKYLPDEVYLFLSKEMYESHILDNRYLYCLDKLGQHLGHRFQHKLIIREDLTEVQDHDIFYEIFRKEIAKIEAGMDATDKLYVNISSGTPAMKNALVVMAEFAEFRFEPIQVSTPRRSINMDQEARRDYHVEEKWETNADNQEDYEDRCSVVRLANLTNLKKEDLIKRFLEKSDYLAAYTLAESMKEHLSIRSLKLLKAAKERSCLNLAPVEQIEKELDCSILPIKDKKQKPIFEFALLLELKIRRGECADFIRGTTPIIVKLLEEIVRKECGINVEDYCDCDERGGVPKWNLQKLGNNPVLKQKLDEGFKNRKFQRGPIYSYHLNIIIQSFSKNKRLRDEVRKIVWMEGRVRNVAAHVVTRITDTDIEKWTNGMNARQIFKKIQYLAKEAGIPAKEKEWESYRLLNQMIISSLESLR